MAKRDMQKMLRALEQMIAKEGRPAARPARQATIGGRVMYVALAGSKRAREALSARAAEVLGAVEKARQATSADLQRLLKVNRNVIAGAVHELKQAALLRSEMIGGGAVMQSAAEAAEAAPAAEPTARAKKERRQLTPDRILGIQIENRRLGLYIPPHSGIPKFPRAVKLVDDRKTFRPVGTKEKKQYLQLVQSAA
jgi:hypothetical protein